MVLGSVHRPGRQAPRFFRTAIAAGLLAALPAVTALPAVAQQSSQGAVQAPSAGPAASSTPSASGAQSVPGSQGLSGSTPRVEMPGGGGNCSSSKTPTS